MLRLNRPQEARPLLERVCAADPDHDYGYTLMALAETYRMLGETQAAADALRNVLQRHSYARARVQLAEILLETRQTDTARAELREVIADDATAPDFQRKRDRFWVRKAKRMLPN